MVAKTELAFPRDLGGSLEKSAFEEYPNRYLTIFSQVKNRVLAVNGEIMAPFNLVEGEASPLGLFANRSLYHGIPLREGEEYLETHRANHNRSAILGRFFFADKDGRIYRDVDLKGIGVLWRDGVNEPGRLRQDEGREGLLDIEDAYTDYQMSEKLLQLGVRTSRTITIIDLEEIVYGGKVIPIDQAFIGLRSIGDFKPVLQVRAFGTRARIEDSYYSGAEEGLRDAKRIVEREMGREMTEEEFSKWFGSTLGKGVATMHNNGFVHGFLTPHNITLDCRIVDLDSMKTSSRSGIFEDHRTAMQTMHWMEEYIFNLNFSSQKHDLLSPFEEGYRKTYKGNIMDTMINVGD